MAPDSQTRREISSHANSVDEHCRHRVPSQDCSTQRKDTSSNLPVQRKAPTAKGSVSMEGSPQRNAKSSKGPVRSRACGSRATWPQKPKTSAPTNVPTPSCSFVPQVSASGAPQSPTKTKCHQSVQPRVKSGLPVWHDSDLTQPEKTLKSAHVNNAEVVRRPNVSERSPLREIHTNIASMTGRTKSTTSQERHFQRVTSTHNGMSTPMPCRGSAVMLDASIELELIVPQSWGGEPDNLPSPYMPTPPLESSPGFESGRSFDDGTKSPDDDSATCGFQARCQKSDGHDAVLVRTAASLNRLESCNVTSAPNDIVVAQQKPPLLCGFRIIPPSIVDVGLEPCFSQSHPKIPSPYTPFFGSAFSEESSQCLIELPCPRLVSNRPCSNTIPQPWNSNSCMHLGDRVMNSTQVHR